MDNSFNENITERLEKLEAFATDAQGFINKLLVKVFPERFVGVPFNPLAKHDPVGWRRIETDQPDTWEEIV